jgi:hypothetical protein
MSRYVRFVGHRLIVCIRIVPKRRWHGRLGPFIVGAGHGYVGKLHRQVPAVKDKILGVAIRCPGLPPQDWGNLKCRQLHPKIVSRLFGIPGHLEHVQAVGCAV